jgi:hypothetical protein
MLGNKGKYFPLARRAQTPGTLRHFFSTTLIVSVELSLA